LNRAWNSSRVKNSSSVIGLVFVLTAFFVVLFCGACCSFSPRAGRSEKNLVLAARFSSRPSYEQASPKQSLASEPGLRQINPVVVTGFITAGFSSRSPGFAALARATERRKRKRNAEKRIGQSSAPAGAAAASTPKGGGSSPLGVPPRFSQSDCHRLAQLQARHPGTWRERTILWTANRGEDRTHCHGRYPRPPVPVQGSHLPRRS
jgi:hypothetical protein